jgi:diacylglycerol kinase family enzyme
MDAAMTLAVRVLMNERSGGCDGRRAEIEAAFLDRGLACKVTPLQPHMVLAWLRIPAGTAVVAAGGDGTINSVASMLAGTETCMGVLALGTLNHFAKDLGLPLEVREAAGVIAEGAPKAVDVGEVNGHIFVNNSSLGFYPGMVLERERMKKAGRNKWLSLLIASARGLLRFRQLSVCITLSEKNEDGSAKKIVRTTPFLFIGNNEYTLQGTAAGTRVRLNGGRLHLALAPGATRRTLLRLCVAALRNRVHEEDHFESFCVEEFTVEQTRRRSRVSLDGELRKIDGPLHYRIRPGALHVLCPRQPGERTA